MTIGEIEEVQFFHFRLFFSSITAKITFWNRLVLMLKKQYLKKEIE